MSELGNQMNALMKFSPQAHWTFRIEMTGDIIYHGVAKLPNLTGGT